MQTEERYDDLTVLFEAQDDALQNEVFVEQVMKPIRRRSRWRAPLLFGAGGIGLGVALSQIGGVWGAIKAQAPASIEADLSVSLEAIPTAQLAMDTQSIWVIAAVLMMASCALLVMSERA